jgi:hypothetical protein
LNSKDKGTTKKKEKKRDILVPKINKLKLDIPLPSNLISSSFFVHFEQFEKIWVYHLKIHNTLWNYEDNEAMHKDVKFQNMNYSYVPKSNMSP